MGRPCHCGRAGAGDYDPGQCLACWKWANSPYWRAKWGGPAEAPPPGLGDEVEALIKAVGLDRLAKAYEKVTGRPCGCGGRKKMLNKLPAVLPRVRALLGVGIPHRAEVETDRGG